MSRSIKVATLVSIAMAISIGALVQRGRSDRVSRVLHVLPSTSKAVLRIDLSALERSMAARTLIEGVMPEGALSEIESTCGFDPAHDLAEVVLWVRGTDREPLESFGLMLVGKNVDAFALAECHRDLVAARGGEVVRLEAATGPLLASRDRASAIAMVDERTVVTGSVATVTEAMAVQHGSLPSLDERPVVADMWTELSPGAIVAAAVEPPDHWRTALTRGTALDEGAPVFEGIDGIGLAVGGRKGQTATLRLEAETPDLAARSAEGLRQWVASPPSAVGPPWNAVLRSGQVTKDGRHVTLRTDLSSLAPPP